MRNVSDKFVKGIKTQFPVQLLFLKKHAVFGGLSWNLILSVSRKSIEKIQIFLKSDKNNGYLTWRPIYIF